MLIMLIAQNGIMTHRFLTRLLTGTRRDTPG
jgi:hypothetical protein